MAKIPVVRVVGPTAVGKSEYALKLAKGMLADGSGVAGVDLISADSKQVYKGLEIITGADDPNNWPPNIALHGVSYIEVYQEWSVSQFAQLAQGVLRRAVELNRGVIMVGGTGLYHKYAFSTDVQLRVKPVENVRVKAAEMSVEELQSWAKKTDPDFFMLLNNSDQNNPRRLVRLIERAEKKAKSSVGAGATDEVTLESAHQPSLLEKFGLQDKTIGIALPLDKLRAKILDRVTKRLENGALNEVKKLQEMTDHSPTPQALSTLGVAQLLALDAGEISRDQCIESWALKEFQYAKRQLTWWKKQRVDWEE